MPRNHDFSTCWCTRMSRSPAKRGSWKGFFYESPKKIQISGFFRWLLHLMSGGAEGDCEGSANSRTCWFSQDFERKSAFAKSRTKCSYFPKIMEHARKGDRDPISHCFPKEEGGKKKNVLFVTAMKSYSYYRAQIVSQSVAVPQNSVCLVERQVKSSVACNKKTFGRIWGILKEWLTQLTSRVG